METNPITHHEAELIRKFTQYHYDNPKIYELFKRFAREVARSGMKRYSADAVVHRIRWYVDIETRSRDDFKITNNHVAFYARMWRHEYPRHKNLFQYRASAADRADIPKLVEMTKNKK